MQSVADSFPHKIHQNSQYKYYHHNKYRPQQQRQYTVDLLHTKPLLPGIAPTQILMQQIHSQRIGCDPHRHTADLSLYAAVQKQTEQPQ